MSADSEYYYTLSEVADRLRVSERTVRRWVHAGRLGARRFGRQLRIPRESLESFDDVAEASISEAWTSLSEDAFAEDWDNELDADYDNWEQHYATSDG